MNARVTGSRLSTTLLFHVFMVFLGSAALLLLLVRSLQVFARFGSFSPKGRQGWFAIAASILIVIIGYRSITSLSPGTWGLAIVLGIAAGTLLLITARPQWPTDRY